MNHVGTHLWLFASWLCTNSSPLLSCCQARWGGLEGERRRAQKPGSKRRSGESTEWRSSGDIQSWGVFLMVQPPSPKHLPYWSGHFPTRGWKLYHSRKIWIQPPQFQVFLIPLMGQPHTLGLARSRAPSKGASSSKAESEIFNVWEASWFHQRNLSLSYEKINELLVGLMNWLVKENAKSLWTHQFELTILWTPLNQPGSAVQDWKPGEKPKRGWVKLCDCPTSSRTLRIEPPTFWVPNAESGASRKRRKRPDASCYWPSLFIMKHTSLSLGFGINIAKGGLVPFVDDLAGNICRICSSDLGQQVRRRERLLARKQGYSWRAEVGLGGISTTKMGKNEW